HAAASLFRFAQSQDQGSPARSAPINPVSKSVIDSSNLAKAESHPSRQKAESVRLQNVFPEARSIQELEAQDVRANDEGTEAEELQPLISSPAPSQSFLAQEDAPQVGTGTSVIPPDTAGA